VFGDECKLGNNCIIREQCTFGNSCELGKNCVWLGVTVFEWLTLANVDGSGRQVKIVKHANGVRIEAGCFIGTAEEFLYRAQYEEKTVYVSVIKAVVEAL
jgi:acetyltransferase-like isoleucine patch superfamily enzyme